MQGYQKGLLLLNDRLIKLIGASNLLMEKDFISEADFHLYKDSCHKVLKDVIKMVDNEVIIELSISGLDLKVRSSESFLSRLFYRLFYTGAPHQHQAPFLSGGSQTDNYKSFVFFMKTNLDGILWNLKKHVSK